MSEAPQNLRILNVLPDEEFFCRDSEVQKWFNAGLDVSRSLQPSCFLSGGRKSGKTEILKRVYSRLFLEQDRVIPFYHSVPKRAVSSEALCRDYFYRAVLQLLSFLQKDPMRVASEDCTLNPVIRLAHESQLPWLIEAIDHFHASLGSRDLQAAAGLAINFPAMAAARCGLYSYVILDDFHHVTSLPPTPDLPLLLHNFLQALRSRQAPHLFVGPSKSVLRRLFGTAELAGHLEVQDLRPMNTAEAQVFFEGLSLRFDVPFVKDLSLQAVEQLNNNPFYMRTLVLAARREGMDFCTSRHFVELYTHELTQGSIHLYFDSLLRSSSLSAAERVRAVELLRLCARHPGDFPAFQFFKSKEREEENDVDRIFTALDEALIVDYDLGVVSAPQDSVFEDWLEWNYQHKLCGHSTGQLEAQLTGELLKRINRSADWRPYSETLERIKQLLRHMNCQSVSGLLLDQQMWQESHEDQNGQAREAELASEDEFCLPEIVSVTVHPMPGPEIVLGGTLLIGRGFEGGRYEEDLEIAWLTVYRPSPKLLGLEEMQQFYNKCQQVIREENLRRVRLWMIAEGRFNQAALSFAAEQEILTSSIPQLEQMFNSIVNELSLASIEMPRALATYDLAIPLTLDAELVAVRALEQVAESLHCDDRSKAQMRMALLDACVKAKESGVIENGRIHLSLQTSTESLRILLSTQGMPLRELPSEQNNGAGWDLKMLQALMDDVHFSHSRQGLELAMTKYLRLVKKEAV